MMILAKALSNLQKLLRIRCLYSSKVLIKNILVKFKIILVHKFEKCPFKFLNLSSFIAGSGL